VQSEFADDVSELPVGPVFTGQRNKNNQTSIRLVILVRLTSEDGTHREFRNVVGKLTLHIVQLPNNQETTLISR
jgi:hypothetical protein